MPPEKVNSHNLRERSHNLTIPLIVNNMLRKNFVYRLLFRDIVLAALYNYCLLFFHMYALRMSVVNKEATYFYLLSHRQAWSKREIMGRDICKSRNSWSGTTFIIAECQKS